MIGDAQCPLMEELCDACFLWCWLFDVRNYLASNYIELFFFFLKSAFPHVCCNTFKHLEYITVLGIFKSNICSIWLGTMSSRARLCRTTRALRACARLWCSPCWWRRSFGPGQSRAPDAGLGWRFQRQSSVAGILGWRRPLNRASPSGSGDISIKLYKSSLK